MSRHRFRYQQSGNHNVPVRATVNIFSPNKARLSCLQYPSIRQSNACACAHKQINLFIDAVSEPTLNKHLKNEPRNLDSNIFRLSPNLVGPSRYIVTIRMIFKFRTFYFFLFCYHNVLLLEFINQITFQNWPCQVLIESCFMEQWLQSLEARVASGRCGRGKFRHERMCVWGVILQLLVLFYCQH